MPAPLIFKDLLQGHFDPRQVSWQPFRPGVEIARLYGGEPDQASAALLRYAPNAKVPRHIHHGFEHILILSGSQRDDHGTYTAGTMLISPPGSAHAISSEEGCVVLAIWERPVETSRDSSKLVLVLVLVRAYAPRRIRFAPVPELKYPRIFMKRKTRSGGVGRRTTDVKASSAAREPWLLATSLTCSCEAVLRAYGMRMQVEQSFRDSKNHRHGWAHAPRSI